ncbi:hypothetical protein CAEBREN_05892 [Caenorhabditis brenneri]|uniref:Uncharacterized protein n=1 Tax=Caenorhabditis brenneri TaxID=135651 RepID=G0NDW5_CAEBE|nr:hypothetical protein CAEBREN_05892 [Caenorhabditis brenneri]
MCEKIYASGFPADVKTYVEQKDSVRPFQANFSVFSIVGFPDDVTATKRRIECLENDVTRCTNELTESRTNLLEVRGDVARLQQEVELGAGREGVVARYREELEDVREDVERLVEEIAHGVAREEVCFRFTKKDKLEFFLISARGGIITGSAAKPNRPLLVHFVSRALQISHQKTLCPRVRAHFSPAMSRNDMSNGQRHGRGTSEDETCNPTETDVVPHVGLSAHPTFS